jgi:hypothetical protein
MEIVSSTIRQSVLTTRIITSGENVTEFRELPMIQTDRQTTIPYRGIRLRTT